MDKKFVSEKLKDLAKELEAILKDIEGEDKKRAYTHDKAIPCTFELKDHSSKTSKKKPIKKAELLRNSPRIAIEPMQSTANQNYPLFFLTKELRLRKIESLHAKEHYIAVRKIRKLSYLMQQWIYYRCLQNIKVTKKESIDFYEMFSQREERHFRIDRVIKYLSDP